MERENSVRSHTKCPQLQEGSEHRRVRKEEEKVVSTYKKAFVYCCKGVRLAHKLFFHIKKNVQNCPIQVSLFTIQITMAKVVLHGAVGYWSKVTHYTAAGQAWGIEDMGVLKGEERI